MTRDEWKAHRRDHRKRVRRMPKALDFEPALLRTITRGRLGLA